MRPYYRLVDTDNFGGDYPDEKWAVHGSFFDKYEAEEIQNILNRVLHPGSNSARFIKVVTMPYQLKPGFEP